MPYRLVKDKLKNGYFVVNALSGKKYSNKPIPKRRAEKQLILLTKLFLDSMEAIQANLK